MLSVCSRKEIKVIIEINNNYWRTKKTMRRKKKIDKTLEKVVRMKIVRLNVAKRGGKEVHRNLMQW